MRRFVFIAALMAILILAMGVSFVAQGQQQTTYVVQYGDTLYRISIRFGVSIQSLVTANAIPNPNLIYAGQRLVIPTGGGTVPPPVTPQPPGQEVTHVVVRGETLGGIARRYGSTVTAIAQRNGIVNVNLIFAGQRLIIPTGGTTVPPPVVPTVPPVVVTAGPPPISGFALGGHVESFSNPQILRDAGMTWVKRQVRWSQGTPASSVQGLVDNARANGFKLLLGVVGDKNQLAANPSAYYADFANFLGGVAALGVDAIEVWNEPNIDREWPAGQINGANYTQMLAQAYGRIKASNPNTLVISGAPAPTGFFGGTCQAAGCDDNIFIRQMRDAGAANVMDCVGIHYNEGILPPTARSGDPRGNSSHYSRYYPTMVELYSGTFPSKSLCFTELGYLTPEGLGALPAGWDWASNTSLAQQAQWLGDAVRLSRQNGRVRLLIVWNVDFTTYNPDPQAGFAITRGGVCTACASLRAAMQ